MTAKEWTRLTRERGSVVYSLLPYLIGLGLLLLALTFIPVIGQVLAIVVLGLVVFLIYHALRPK